MSDILNKRIIIVDDNEFSRVLINLKLKKHGFCNMSVPDGSIEAWEEIADAQLGDSPVDLVITDLNMPGLDGMDLISKIKDDPLSNSIKIIVVSADSEQTIIDIVKSLGALAYLTKPVVAHELVSVVEAALNGAEIPETKGMFPVEKISPKSN